MDASFLPVFNNIKKHVSLKAEDEVLIAARLQTISIGKKEFLLKEGQPCSAIYFIKKGMLRAYCRDFNGVDHLIMFAMEDWWITDIYGFAKQQPSLMFIDALEDSEVVRLSKQDMESLFTEVPVMESFFRIIMQNAYVREQLRSIQNLTLPAAERYKNFTVKYPLFVQRVPQKYIASYLGITPEFLSVLRSRKDKKIS